VDELSVQLRDGRLRLYWERAGCELAVAAGHMLNAAAAPEVCRLIGEIAADGSTSLAGFDWGAMFSMPFLPRVRTGRTVLHPAQWLVAAHDLGLDRIDRRRAGRSAARAAAATADPDRFADRLARWRESWWVPRHVYLTEADNRLLLDLDDAGHREQLCWALVKAADQELVLQEGLPDPDGAWLPGPGGRYAVELVVPMVRADLGCPADAKAPRSDLKLAGLTPAAPAAGQPKHRPPLQTDGNRIRRPGSDWLYFILPGSRSGEDAVLTGPFAALADRLVEDGDSDGWYFVRYADPEPHLRVRIHGNPRSLIERVLPALTAGAARTVAEGARLGVSLQVYERELERYGGPVTTGICERIACIDSVAVRRMLRTDEGRRATRLDRVELGVVSTGALLVALATDPAEPRRWCAEIGPSGAESGSAFRERKTRLRNLVGAVGIQRSQGGDDAWRPVLAALADRTAAVAPLAAQLRQQYRDGAGLRPMDELVPSLAHLHANRLGLDRTTERLVLGLLDRTLRSLEAYPLPETIPLRRS
jgi:thiopeptide-type bacteriocin biosynthesis protein